VITRACAQHARRQEGQFLLSRMDKYKIRLHL
jgi:hypothetical protein